MKENVKYLQQTIQQLNLDIENKKRIVIENMVNRIQTGALTEKQVKTPPPDSASNTQAIESFLYPEKLIQ